MKVYSNNTVFIFQWAMGCAESVARRADSIQATKKGLSCKGARLGSSVSIRNGCTRVHDETIGLHNDMGPSFPLQYDYVYNIMMSHVTRYDKTTDTCDHGFSSSWSVCSCRLYTYKLYAGSAVHTRPPTHPPARPPAPERDAPLILRLT